MFSFNDDDLFLIKFMLASIPVDKKSLKKAKQFDDIKNIVKEECGKDIADNFIKEALFYGNCFNVLHLQNGCPQNYQDSEWGIDICDDVILFVRLFQHLNLDEFANMLETCTNTTLEEFKCLELELETPNDKNYIENIIIWLRNHKISFADNVQRMVNLRKMNNGGPAPMVTNEVSIQSSMDCIGGPAPMVTNEVSIQSSMDCIDNSSPMVTDEVCEPVSSEYKGICVVISNKYFKPNGTKTLPIRNGTEKDEENIDRTFSSLGYKVKIYRDVKNIEMPNIIEETQTYVNASHKLMIVFILSHGKECSFFTTDNCQMPFDKIWKPFSNLNFQKFSGKPKVFFFVCCQGEELNKAVAVPIINESDLEWDGPACFCPEVSNFFFGYATCETFLSCRTQSKGTYYVDCLCEVIQDHPDATIIDIHTEVQSRISKVLITNKEGDKGFQMPCFMNILTDNISFID